MSTTHLSSLCLSIAASLAACNPTSPTTASTQQPAAAHARDDEQRHAGASKTAGTTSDEAPKPSAAAADAPGAQTRAADASAAVATDPAVKAARDFIASKDIDRKAPNWRTKAPQPPKLAFEPTRKYFWLLNTSEGPIKVRFMPDVAPMHVSSAIYLTELGFYDGLTFHRVIPGFMAQGGCPLGNGAGGPGYRYAGEFAPGVGHSKPGMLSTANTGQPSTDGSQFFLTFEPKTVLDGKHTVFGEIVEGFENLKKIESHGSAGGRTAKTIKIDSAKVIVE